MIYRIEHWRTFKIRNCIVVLFVEFWSLILLLSTCTRHAILNFVARSSADREDAITIFCNNLYHFSFYMHMSIEEAGFQELNNVWSTANKLVEFLRTLVLFKSSENEWPRFLIKVDVCTWHLNHLHDWTGHGCQRYQ